MQESWGIVAKGLLAPAHTFSTASLLVTGMSVADVVQYLFTVNHTNSFFT